MRVIYLAHPLAGPDRAENLARAARWVRWAYTRGVAPVAPWILYAGEDEGPAARARGLEADCSVVARCQEVWLVGGRVSDGMEVEARMAHRLSIPVIDMTSLGEEPPA